MSSCALRERACRISSDKLVLFNQTQCEDRSRTVSHRQRPYVKKDCLSAFGHENARGLCVL